MLKLRKTYNKRFHLIFVSNFKKFINFTIIFNRKVFTVFNHFFNDIWFKIFNFKTIFLSFFNFLPRIVGVSSSSLPDEAESGGEIMAPTGMPRSSVMGGGDCRTLFDKAAAMPLRSSEVPWGVIVPTDTDPSLTADADGVRRCL